MESGYVAALVAALTFGFVEGLARFYPARPAWNRLREARGRAAVRRMRERFEASAQRRTTHVLALLLLVLIAGWVGAASLLDKRWYEVVLDVVPGLIVVAAMLRMPSAFRQIAARMRRYERETEDGSDDLPPDGPGRIPA